MHPIERLRHVARAGRADPSELAAEAAWALADLAEREAPALVPACRRLLDRQPGCGPLWWLAARVLSAGDPAYEAQRCAQDLEDDPTRIVMLEALPSGARAVRKGAVSEVSNADLVLVTSEALGPGGMVADSSCGALLDAARTAEVPVWVESGVGRVLPQRIWEAMCRRLGASATHGRNAVSSGSSAVDAHGVRFAPATGHSGVFDHFVVEKVVGPTGVQPLVVALAGCDCPEPPELLVVP